MNLEELSLRLNTLKCLFSKHMVKVTVSSTFQQFVISGLKGTWLEIKTSV